MRKVNVVIFLLCVVLSLIFTTVSAQQKASLVGRFPFRQFLGGVILVQGKLDTISTPINFILDTGSGGISLDSSTCAEFNIPTTKTDTTLSGIGGIKKVRFLFNQVLDINGLRMDSLNFHISDYSYFTKIYGVKVDGIIGYSFFSRYIVKINYDKKEIEVFSKGEMKYPRKGTLLSPRFTKLATQIVTIEDERKLDFPFYFDTGAGLALLLNNRFENDSGIIKKSRKLLPIGVQGILGRTPVRITIINRLKLGRYRFKKVPVYLYEDTHNVTSYPRTGGLLGSENFRRFNLIINYGTQEIHIQPNTHFYDTFDYGYTGMNIAYEDDKIVVDELIKNSPAALAGIRLGDQVLSVGKNVSLNIESYRSDLQVPDQLYEMLILRNGKLEKVILKTGSIF